MNFFDAATGQFKGSQPRRNRRLLWVFNELSPRYISHYQQHQYRITKTRLEGKTILWYRNIDISETWARLSFLGWASIDIGYMQPVIMYEVNSLYLLGAKIAERHLNKIIRKNKNKNLLL